MASGFNFNFSGDDIDETEDIPGAPSITVFSPPHEGGPEPPEVRTERHDLRELFSTLPSRISYNTTLVSAPQHDRRVLIPRRALFDVRLQIMAESNISTTDPAPPKPQNETIHLTNGTRPRRRRKDLAGKPLNNGPEEGHDIGLGDSDIERNVYEGGFKSWEGAIDLARLVLERGPNRDVDELSRVDGIVELGCGTALPSLVLFQHALKSDLSIPFTLSDYNIAVLRLVTLPNFLLIWALQNAPNSFSPTPPSLASSTSSDQNQITDADGDLEISPSLVDAFLADLSQRQMPLTFLSGPWSPALESHIATSLQPSQTLLILAAETIYNPESLSAFTDLLLTLLRRVRHGKALIAAKRVYFGVGGSVDAFKEAVGAGGGVAGEVQNSGIKGCDRSLESVGLGDEKSGVGRCLLDVQMA